MHHCIYILSLSIHHGTYSDMLVFQLVMNHDNGFILGIAHFSAKPLIEYTPKSTQNHPQVIFLQEIKVTKLISNDKQTANTIKKSENSHFVHLHNIKPMPSWTKSMLVVT